MRWLRTGAGFAMAMLLSAAPQTRYDREASARDYVRFLVEQLDQWRQEFPQQFYLALMRPPLDSGKLSEAAKASAGELGDSIERLAAMSGAKDVLTNAEFRGQLDKTLAAAKEVNQTMGAALSGGAAERLGTDPIHAEQSGAHI